VSSKITPNVYNYLKTTTYDKLGKHNRLQDYGEAYEIGYLIELKERLSAKVIYNILNE
jgi:hypothetical protein